MNRQLTFFDDESDRDLQAKRLARRSDPQTSHEAAAEAVASGRLSKQCVQILALLVAGPQPSSLRKQGHNIVAYRERGEWWYRLEE